MIERNETTTIHLEDGTATITPRGNIEIKPAEHTLGASVYLTPYDLAAILKIATATYGDLFHILANLERCGHRFTDTPGHLETVVEPATYQYDPEPF